MSGFNPFSSDHWLSPPVDSSPDWGWAPPSLGGDLLDAESPDVFFPLSTTYNYNLTDLISGESSNQELSSGPSLQQNRRSPESDLRRSNGLRPRNRRFRVSPSDDGDVSPSPMADQLARDIVSSGKDLGNRRKYDAKRLPGDDSYDEFKEKFTAASNFECNICFDIAREPVVTSCGHLFCWSCLYRWLHVHSDFRECPVCKGVVEDVNITPIYGRASDEYCVGKEKEGLEIPPRPGGNRHESFRQQLRALSRRSIDAVNGEEVIPESLVVSVPQSRSSILLYRDSSDFWHDLAIQSPERNAAVSADRDISVSRFAGGNDPDGRVPIPVPAALLADHSSASSTLAVIHAGIDLNNTSEELPTPVPAALLADHSSASSTLAVIHAGIDLNNTSEELNNVGSSRVHIRRRSGSLDLDEELRHADRRWRS